MLETVQEGCIWKKNLVYVSHSSKFYLRSIDRGKQFSTLYLYKSKFFFRFYKDRKFITDWVENSQSIFTANWIVVQGEVHGLKLRPGLRNSCYLGWKNDWTDRCWEKMIIIYILYAFFLVFSPKIVRKFFFSFPFGYSQIVTCSETFFYPFIAWKIAYKIFFIVFSRKIAYKNFFCRFLSEN